MENLKKEHGARGKIKKEQGAQKNEKGAGKSEKGAKSKKLKGAGSKREDCKRSRVHGAPLTEAQVSLTNIIIFVACLMNISTT